jgi:DNA repair protein RadC
MQGRTLAGAAVRRRDGALRPLFVAEPDGRYVPAADSMVIRAATQAVTRALARGPSMASPAAARRLLPAMLGSLEHEVFCIAHLDKRHRLIHFEQLFRGTVDGASVHPREVVKSALRWNSSALIAVHNHPSGSATPSQADELITTQLKEALALIDCRLLDHCIVGGGDVFSLAERGLM